MDIAAFKPETAQLILQVVNYLVAAGFVDKPGGRKPQFIPPQAPIYIKNDTGEEIPAFGCVQVSGTVEYGGQNYLEVTKPVDTSGTAGWYLFNGLQPIEIDGYGIAYDGPLARMLTDGSAVTSGDKWGPVVGSFEVAPGGSLVIAAGSDDILTDIMRGFIISAAGTVIEYTIDSIVTSSEADYSGLEKATVTVHGGPGNLVGTSVSVYDHSGCIFNLPDMTGYTGWAFYGQFKSMDTSGDCKLTPFHYAAFNRCCSPDSGLYEDCSL